MALVTPPSWLQNGSYPAESDRLTQQALYNTTGIIGSSSMAVTANSPAGMSVRVAAGWAAIIGTTQPNMGAYVAYNDATEVLTITAANPTNPRIDRIVATVRDAYYSGSNNDVIFQVIAGTPAGSPSAPATPANSISLATVLVGAGVTQINSGNITDTRVATTSNLVTGKILQVVNAIQPAGIIFTSTDTPVDTGLSATITPTSASSKILVIAQQNGLYKSGGDADSSIQLYLLRGSTQISFFGGNATWTDTVGTNAVGGAGISILDTPATTSPVTYKTQFGQGFSTILGVIFINFGGQSSLTLMEVAP